MITTLLTVALLAGQADSLQRDDLDPAPGVVDRALAFDGVDDFVCFPRAESLRYPGSGGWTVELWVKPIVYPARETSVFGQESVGVDGRDPYSLRAHPTHFEFRVDGPRGGTERVRFDLALETWQHVACVYENGQRGRWLSVYVNGELVERNETGVRMESRLDPVYMGRLGRSAWRGLVDEVRVWGAALGEQEIAWVSEGVMDEDDPRLRGWWSFDEAHGGVTLDRSRGAGHGVLGVPSDSFDTTAPRRVGRSGGGISGTR